MTKNPDQAGGGMSGAALFAFELVQEEMNSLYALANAAVKELQPPEGTKPTESANFFAYELVNLMHQRLERTDFENALRSVLSTIGKGGTAVSAAPTVSKSRAAA